MVCGGGGGDTHPCHALLIIRFLSVIPNDALKAPKEKCGESLPNERTESTSPVVRTEVVRRVPKEK